MKVKTNRMLSVAAIAALATITPGLFADGQRPFERRLFPVHPRGCLGRAACSPMARRAQLRSWGDALPAAFGGITVAEQIAAALKPIPVLAPYAEALGLGVVVVALTYLSLIIGELVPKRLALANPEGIACRFARLMDRLSWLARPAIWVLGVSTDGVLRLLRAPPQKADAVSEEEVKLLLQEGMEAGVFHAAEPAMVESGWPSTVAPFRTS